MSEFSLDKLPQGGVAWLRGDGDHSDIVLSTRVRVARNIEGYAFGGKSKNTERLQILEQTQRALQGSPSTKDGQILRMDELDPISRQLLYERHIVSKELSQSPEHESVRAGAAVQIGQKHSIMVNEEDHLRIQSITSGLDLYSAYEVAAAIDGEVGQKVPFSFHQEFGYLTACPTNVGTGLRASVLIHLPALVLTKEISRVLAGLQQIGLTYRGLYGEGSEVIGNFFQISNQTTLGRSEFELVEYLHSVVQHVIEKEMQARHVLIRDAGYIIEDKLWRAYGTLRYARSLTIDETMNFLSGVRLAVGLKLITNLSVYTLNRLLIFSQSAHLAHREGRDLVGDEANVVRAAFVRETLEGEANERL